MEKLDDIIRILISIISIISIPGIIKFFSLLKSVPLDLLFFERSKKILFFDFFVGFMLSILLISPIVYTNRIGEMIIYYLFIILVSIIVFIYIWFKKSVYDKKLI